MNKLHFLNKLLNGIEIKWIALGKATKYEQPTSYLVASKNYDNKHKTPVLTAGKTFILGYTNEDAGIYKASDKPVIIFDDFTTANKWVDFDFKVKSSAIKMITSSDDSKFLLKYIYYWLNSLPDTLDQSDHKRQWIGNYANKFVPIPCPDNPEKSLAIQNKIVGILDKFTELTTELTTGLTIELSLQKKQYEYYYNKLFNFKKEHVRWKQLGDIAIIGTGSRNTNEAVQDGKYPFYVRSQEKLSINEYEFDETAIITAGDGVGVGKVFHFVSGKYSLHQRAYRIVVIDECILPKFLFYFIKHDFSRYLTTTSVHASVTSLRKPMFEKYLIPVPPLSEQIYIVSIMERYCTFANSFIEDLPHEIELLQKKYKYYRDLLFSFPKPQEVA